MKFEVAVFKDKEVIGAEVNVISEGTIIDTITVTDAKSMDKINSQINEIINNYTSRNELGTILENKELHTTINATRLGGNDSSYYSTTEHTHNYAPLNHADAYTDHGAGSETEYGHVKTINNLSENDYSTGRALSAYQGKVLNDKMNARGGYFKLEKNILDAEKGDLVIYCYEADGSFMKEGTEIELYFYYFDTAEVGTPQTIKVGRTDQDREGERGAITRENVLEGNIGRPFCISVNKKGVPSINMSAILSRGLRKDRK